MTCCATRLPLSVGMLPSGMIRTSLFLRRAGAVFFLRGSAVALRFFEVSRG